MPDEEVDLTVDPGAPDPDADPSEPQADEHGESIHPTDGLGQPIEPPQPSNLKTRVETPADAEPPPPLPPPPVSTEMTAPEPVSSPPPAPSISELTEEELSRSINVIFRFCSFKTPTRWSPT